MINPVSFSNAPVASFSASHNEESAEDHALTVEPSLVDVIMNRDVVTFKQMMVSGFKIHLSTIDRKESFIKVIHKASSLIIHTVIDKGSDSPETKMLIQPISQIHTVLSGENPLDSLVSSVEHLLRGNPVGHSILTWGVTQRNTQFVAMLLGRGSPVNHTDVEGNTPLIYAARGGLAEMGALLLSAGADVQARNAFHENALFYAQLNKNVSLCNDLKDAGARRAVAFAQNLYRKIPSRAKYAPLDQMAINEWEAITQAHIDDYDDIAFNSFNYDIKDAIKMAKKIIKNQKIDSSDLNEISRVKTDCLLGVLSEKYSSVEEQFDQDQMEDLIRETDLLHAQTIRVEDYDYSSYDQETLGESIDEYESAKTVFAQMKAQAAKQASSPSEETESIESLESAFRARKYRVTRHRMPGFGATDFDYNKLCEAAVELFPTYKPTPLAPKRIRFEV